MKLNQLHVKHILPLIIDNKLIIVPEKLVKQYDLQQFNPLLKNLVLSKYGKL